MRKSMQIIRNSEEHPIYKIYQQAIADITTLLENEPEYTSKYDIGIDRLIASEFANAGEKSDEITNTLAEITMKYTEQVYFKYQDARIEEEINDGFRNENGELKEGLR